jgi:polyhydroxyalkanoate synthase
MINWQLIRQEIELISHGLSKIETSIHSSYNWNEKTDVLFTDQAYQLLRYHNDRHADKAILLVYSWVNSPDILDFSEEISLVKTYQSLGFDVFLIKWKLSNLDQKTMNVEQYYSSYIDQAIQLIHQKQYLSYHLTGICQGGVFALAYAALYPNTISSVTLMMAPIDHSDHNTLIYRLSQKMMLMVEAQNMIPGLYLQNFFSMLKPSQYYLGRVIDAASRKQIKEYKIIEAWLNQTPDMPAELLKNYIQEFIDENILISGKIDLSKITCPVLNLYAKYDRLVPSSSSISIENKLQCHYLTCELSGGHLSVLSDQKQQSIFKSFIKNNLLGR